MNEAKPYAVGIIATLIALAMGGYVMFGTKGPVNLQIFMIAAVVLGWGITAFQIKKYPIAMVGVAMAAVIWFTP